MKCGIEIHQRVCSHKLFCKCDSTGNKGKKLADTNRLLHSAVGETGEVDSAVRFEALRKNKFFYESFDNTSCLVELDEEPPLHINEEALSVALSVAKHLKMMIPDELHVMRKTVIDGSNTGGFQRTMIIGLGTDSSVIKTSDGGVRIKDLELEEESARIIERTDKGTRYDLSGLGIPLIEIGTHPDIKTPQQAYETAMHLGELLRLTGRAQRGIGTIRQDINVSIDGGARVEIKGFQDIRMIKELIINEVKRQESLLALKDELTGFDTRKINLTKFFEESESKIVKGKSLIMGLVVTGFSGVFKRKLNDYKTLGSEVADYARAMGVKGLIHSDEDLSKYNLLDEFIKIRNELGLRDNDLLLIISGEGDEVTKALDAVDERVHLLNDCVPEETRTANPDASSSYARPLPGGARMYPETDSPVISVNDSLLKSVFRIESKEERQNKLKSLGLPDNLVKELLLNPRLNLFYELIKSLKNLEPKVIVQVLIESPKEVKSRFSCDTMVLSDEHFTDLLKLLNDSAISAQAVIPMLEKLCKAPELRVIDVSGDYKLMTNAELSRIIKKISSDNRGLAFKVLMGLVMKEVGGRADGSKVLELIKKLVQ